MGVWAQEIQSLTKGKIWFHIELHVLSREDSKINNLIVKQIIYQETDT
jgi:uncharacterized membrane protein YobD (UPF0266 family)